MPFIEKEVLICVSNYYDLEPKQKIKGVRRQ
jgi:hypothetical protein